ncbi:MAG TPA: hypothetical protein VMB48_17150 [Steroidobacteraceae bacterium]|nr:hypothetical protein [Steroidobacteraceae bacterium]
MSETAGEYLARCHCGAICARYHTMLPTPGWSVRACKCGFCRAHASLTVSDASGSLEFLAVRPELLQRYRFGSGVTEFLICRACGVYLGASMQGQVRRFGVLNVRALRPIPTDLPESVPMDYDLESAFEKRHRRETRWTPLTAESL